MTPENPPPPDSVPQRMELGDLAKVTAPLSKKKQVFPCRPHPSGNLRALCDISGNKKRESARRSEMSMQIGHFGIEYYVVCCFQMSARTKGSIFHVVSWPLAEDGTTQMSENPHTRPPPLAPKPPALRYFCRNIPKRKPPGMLSVIISRWWTAYVWFFFFVLYQYIWILFKDWIAPKRLPAPLDNHTIYCRSMSHI